MDPVHRYLVFMGSHMGDLTGINCCQLMFLKNHGYIHICMHHIYHIDISTISHIYRTYELTFMSGSDDKLQVRMLPSQ